MKVMYKHNSVHIILVLHLEHKEKEVAIPLSVNLGNREIHTEKIDFAVA